MLVDCCSMFNNITTGPAVMKSSMKENGINCKEEENITGDSPIVSEHNLSKRLSIVGT